MSTCFPRKWIFSNRIRKDSQCRTIFLIKMKQQLSLGFQITGYCKILKNLFSFYEPFNGVNKDVKYRSTRININFSLLLIDRSREIELLKAELETMKERHSPLPATKSDLDNVSTINMTVDLTIRMLSAKIFVVRQHGIVKCC